MRIALIGGRDFQQFPTVSYGGVETCVENLAWGLHKAHQDFVCIVPKREVIRDYPFDIIESDAPPLPGAESNVWPFARSLPAIVKDIKPDVIWCQAFWAAETLKSLDIPIICTFHDFVPDNDRKNAWFTFRQNTWYRFISKFQFNQWVASSPERLLERSFHLHTGLADEEYDFCPAHMREDYFLWVAGLNWGWHTKGLDLFVELAKRHPEEKFVAYGTGNRKIEEMLMGLNRTIDNFEFRGVLKRGTAHKAAFSKARLFIMPTQMPEPFGRTVIESMSKGTPVLGSTNGALPELIQNGVNGFTAESINDYERLLDAPYDYAACFERSKRFHINIEVKTLIARSEQIIGGQPFDAFNPSPSNEFTNYGKANRHSMTIESILSEAMQRHQIGDLNGAEILYNDILTKAPSDADTLNLLGVLSLQRQQSDAAERFLRKAIAVDPTIAEFHHNLGDVLHHQGRTEAAIQSYRYCLKIDPNLEIAKDHLQALCELLPQPKVAVKPLKHHEVIQAVLERIHGKTYLEVGIDGGESFSKIRAKRKFGVDPVLTKTLIQGLLAQSDIEFFRYTTDSRGEKTGIRLEASNSQPDLKVGPGELTELYYTTSDAFFKQHAPRLFAQERIDVALLDGLHTYAQTFQDVINTLNFIDSGGIIVIHDCSPPSEASAFPATSWEAARKMKIPGWSGVWCGDVWKSILRLRATRNDMRVFVLDCDYGIGIVCKGRPENMLNMTLAEIENLTWAELCKNRTTLLNLKPQNFLFDFLHQLNID